MTEASFKNGMQSNSVPSDLRPPDRDETPLSRDEVLRGLREGTIPNGPLAKSYGFSSAVVVQRRVVVEFFDFSEVACS